MGKYSQPDESTSPGFGSRRSFSKRHLALRLAWQVVWLLLASWTPSFMWRWRRMLLIAFGARLGRGVNVYGSASVWYPPNLVMGQGSTIGPHVNCYSMAPVLIGNQVIISQFSHLLTGTHDVQTPDFTLLCAPITIGDRAWLAAGSVIGPGVTVSEGAVLGASGVAFKDLERWTIYAGNPAKPIGPRTIDFGRL